MKAAVCYEIGKPLVIEDIDIAQPGYGEVMMKVGATAVCHSDIHLIKGEFPGTIPIVAGHESAGYIEKIGPGVTGFQVGDRVIASLLLSCGECVYCTTGRPNLCEKVWPRDAVPPYKNKNGEALNQAFLVGSFSEYTIIDRSQLVKIPDNMPFDKACLLSCGVITGFGAVVWRAKVALGKSCVIIGAGGVGLNSIQGAHLVSAYPIIAIDINDKKLEAARKFGATHTINSSKTDPAEVVKSLTGGRGAEYVFITVGSSKVMSQSIELSCPGGMIVWVGLPKITETIPLSPYDFIKPERTLTGSYMGSTNLQNDIPRLINLYQAGKLKLDELITRHYRLEEINEAISAVERGEALRNIIMFE